MSQLDSNPNDARRGRNPQGMRPIQPSGTQSYMNARLVNEVHGGLEVASADRLSRRHIHAVLAVMPRISESRAKGKPIRRISSKVLRTVKELKLVGAHDCVTKPKKSTGRNPE